MSSKRLPYHSPPIENRLRRPCRRTMRAPRPSSLPCRILIPEVGSGYTASSGSSVSPTGPAPSAVTRASVANGSEWPSAPMRTGSRVATAPPPSRLSVAAVPPATAGAPSPLHSPRDLTSHASPPFKAQQPQAGVTRRHSSLIHLCPHYTTDHGMRRRSARALSSSMSAVV